jgi:periplasmic protein TonB
MRLVYFFALSLALHVAALGYPVSFAQPSKAEVIRVTIMPMGQDIGDSKGRGGGGMPPRRDIAKPRAQPAPAVNPTVETQSIQDSARQDLLIDPIEKDKDSNIALLSAVASADKNPNAQANSTSVSFSSDGSNGSRSGGTDGLGSTGTGSGRGSGHGDGTDSSGNGIPLTQARYRDTPRPEYPETARRQGREGRVLLRVLVDDQGRSEHVEINRSSGNDALDRAAVDAIKHWRFYPARYGDRPIESWIKIPIDFALSNSNRR